MSHNLHIKGVEINDLECLKQAVSALNRELNLNMSVEKANTFRTYRGQPNTCDYRVSLPHESHDIGLKANADGTYEIVYDPYGMSRKLAPDATLTYNSTPDQRATWTIAKLVQEYAAQRIEKEAASNGYMTTRSYDKASGEILLSVVQY